MSAAGENKEWEHTTALREAFFAGCAFALGDAAKGYFPNYRAEARRRYPMPLVDVPRVVRLQLGNEYRYVNGQLQSRRPNDGNDGWFESASFFLDDIRMLADLLANPTEQRPADEVVP